MNTVILCFLLQASCPDIVITHEVLYMLLEAIVTTSTQQISALESVLNPVDQYNRARRFTGSFC